jgi:ABC-type glycerol-3-phosphate transport system permease component
MLDPYLNILELGLYVFIVNLWVLDVFYVFYIFLSFHWRSTISYRHKAAWHVLCQTTCWWRHSIEMWERRLNVINVNNATGQYSLNHICSFIRQIMNSVIFSFLMTIVSILPPTARYSTFIPLREWICQKQIASKWSLRAEIRCAKYINDSMFIV